MRNAQKIWFAADLALRDAGFPIGSAFLDRRASTGSD